MPSLNFHIKLSTIKKNSNKIPNSFSLYEIKKLDQLGNSLLCDNSLNGAFKCKGATESTSECCTSVKCHAKSGYQELHPRVHATVLTINSCTKCEGSPGIIHDRMSNCPHFPGHGCMDDLATKQSFDLKAMKVIGALALYF